MTVRKPWNLRTCLRWYSIVLPDQAYSANRAGSTFNWPATKSTAAFGMSSRRGNRASISKNFSIRLKPSLVAPDLFPTSSNSPSSSVQHSMRSSRFHSRRTAESFLPTCTQGRKKVDL